MTTVRNFEDLIAWQKARALTKSIYQISAVGALSKDYGLADQMRRASVSMMANIAEGHDRPGQAEFLRFLGIASGSCAEVRAHLYVALDVGYLSEEAAENLLEKAREVSRILNGLSQSIRKSQHTS